MDCLSHVPLIHLKNLNAVLLSVRSFRLYFIVPILSPNINMSLYAHLHPFRKFLGSRASAGATFDGSFRTKPTTFCPRHTYDATVNG